MYEKPYDLPPPVYNKASIHIARPVAMPEDFGGFYTDWTNISSLKGSVYVSSAITHETDQYVYVETTTITTQHIYLSYNGSEEICPPGTVYNPDTGTCDVLPGYEWNPDSESYCQQGEFEILNNTDFSSLVSETEATDWTSDGVVFNSTSQSDYTGSIAHFGDATCEYVSQLITTDNGEYRYNPTMTYAIDIAYVNINGASSDSTISINIGGEINVYTIERIESEFNLTSGVYSYATGEEMLRLEFPAPSVTPSALAVAEIWQTGDITLEVSHFGITGYLPCEKDGLNSITATDSGITCDETNISEYLWLQDLYRRMIVTFQTDIQGLIPQYLDKIMISHSALQWGEAGEIMEVSGNTMTLSDKLVDTTSGKTIVFRNIDGSISGAYGVQVIDEYKVEVPGHPTWVDKHTFYTIQDAESSQEFIVISVKPNGDDVDIECVEYIEEIYK